MDQVRNEAGFTDEIFLKRLQGRVFLANQFDGNAFPEIARAALHGFINDSHAPSAMVRTSS